MLYVPPISDYKPFYIQFSNGSAIDIKETYKVVVRAHDYPSSLKVKEPYKNQWKDEHGDEEYIGAGGLYAEAFNFTLDCAMFSTNETLDKAIADLEGGMSAFQSDLLGGFFSTYDAWTNYGFKDVRLVEFPKPNRTDYQVWGTSTRILFSVTLKVNDPITRMKLSEGSIVEA